MKEQLNSILLIDDDPIINFIHERIIQSVDGIPNVFIEQTGKGALNFLQQMEVGHPHRPQLILLDINMPAMDGWEFLTKFQRLPIGQQQDIVIIMLTTSQNPDDSVRARRIPAVSSFLQKPLSVSMIYQIMEEYFPVKLHRA